MKFHPDVLACHAQFGGDIEGLQAMYDRPDMLAEITSLRTALAVERERAEKAEKSRERARDEFVARSLRAEASLAEAKRMLKTFADAAETIAQIDKERVEWKITLDYEALVKAEHIRAAARFLAQEEGRSTEEPQR